MRQSLLLSTAVITFITFSLPAEGKRITLVPLSANEVYRILRQVGREDAVPEGRVISQGIAAVSGFAAGLAKGIGGSILFDIAASLLRAQNQTVQTQEICFNSRSLNNINDDYYDDSDDDDNNVDYAALSRQVGIGGTGGTGGTGAGGVVTIGTGAGTNTNFGSGTNTISNILTQTRPSSAINCIVIQQQPAAAATVGAFG